MARQPLPKEKIKAVVAMLRKGDDLPLCKVALICGVSPMSVINIRNAHVPGYRKSKPYAPRIRRKEREIMPQVISSPPKLDTRNLVTAAPKLLAMLKAANHAFYVAGTRKALQEALRGSKELIQEAEGRM